jgi:hypothetical protein
MESRKIILLRGFESALFELRKDSDQPRRRDDPAGCLLRVLRRGPGS